ncbi:MAG: hypothetical protein P8Y18_01760 [Candidatus Bathyarchaeota archaeon]
MKLKVIHLWAAAVISYIFALLLAFIQELIGVAVFSSLYLFLLISTRWADET